MTRLAPDILCLAGVGSIGVGLWWVSPAAALVVVGALVTAAGLLLGRVPSSRKPGRTP